MADSSVTDVFSKASSYAFFPFFCLQSLGWLGSRVETMPASARAFERVLDAVHDVLAKQLGLWQMMRLAQTSPTFLSRVCGRARDLSGVYEFHSDIRKIEVRQLVALLRRCAGLRTVNMSGWTIGGKFVCDEVMYALAAYCTSLRSLTMDSGEITDCAVANVARVHTELVELDLHGQKQLTDGALHAIAQHLPKLEMLNLFGCKGISDSGVVALATRCTALKDLSLDHTRISDAAVSAVAMNCPLLEDLSLWDCDGVTDESIIALVERCPKINDLQLQCTSITCAALVAMAAGECPLHDLGIEGCSHVSDAGVIAMVPKWRTIERLALDLNGTGVTVASMLEVANLPNLVGLDVSVTPCACTDEALLAFSRGCPVLTHLYYEHALARTTPAALDVLRKSHPKLNGVFQAVYGNAWDD